MWKTTRVLDERVRFVAAARRGELSVTELCAVHGVSRKTGYKWLARAAAGESLEDRSRRPLTSPQQLSEDLEELVLELRRARPTWGPRKLLARLLAVHGDDHDWPSASTVGDLLKRNGLVRKRRPRPKLDEYTSPLSPMHEPNAVWCADFKGDFRTGDRQRVLPLTITDGATRYLLRCTAVSRGDTAHVQPVFESAFLEFGLPKVIRTDNGAPFVSIGPAGLTKLSLWFYKLGIHHERTKPGKPTQNARHERMHRTLAEDTANPPAQTLAKQQRRFDVFRRIFNEERPHQALGMKTPSDLYTDSPTPMPARLLPPLYPEHFHVRSVRHDGTINFTSRNIFVSEALAAEKLGLDERENVIAVFFGERRLGGIDRKNMKFDRSLLGE